MIIQVWINGDSTTGSLLAILNSGEYINTAEITLVHNPFLDQIEWESLCGHKNYFRLSRNWGNKQ